MPEVDGEYPTIIGADAVFKGTLKFEKGVRLLGRFEEGHISTKGRVHVAEGAALFADVEAGEIQVEGEVKANLTANGKVFLKASAKLEGDVRAGRLQVEEGASFVGNCVVGPKAEVKPGSRPSVPETAKAKTPEPAQPAGSHATKKS